MIKPKPLLIILVAALTLFLLSLLPWSDWTGGRIKDFSLLSDILPADSTRTADIGGNEYIDPELEAELTQAIGVQAPADTVPAAPQPRVDGQMVLEDYTPDASGLSRLRAALSRRDSEPARIAIIGDSYIEGDIFSQDIRRLLQQRYGGRGVGYVPAHSNVAGFRRTVSVSDNGWAHKEHAAASRSSYFTLMGEYFVSEGPASVRYKGYAKEPSLAAWNEAEVLFVAPTAGRITLSSDSLRQDFSIDASSDVQSIKLHGEMSRLKLDTNIPGLVFIGAWLNDSTGVALDCMSIRGDSGITRRKVSAPLTEQMRQYIDYDLIIVEYGINALTAHQTNYSGYSQLMVEVLQHIKEIYPNSDILMMGIGDRGQKGADGVHSLPTAAAMVEAQRHAAQEAGVLFWDTREAMGGEDGIVDWRERKLANADYIHLNSAGGRALAEELVGSLERMLNNDNAQR